MVLTIPLDDLPNMANHILCLAGSVRKKSLNKQLASQACEIARAAGANATFIDLADVELPIYNGDDEDAHGLPANAIKLQELFRQHNGLIIASPEYNSSFSALLKNTLDWVSRPNGSDDKLASAFANKVAGLLAASPGGFGGLRGLTPLRMMLGNLGVVVVPQQLAVARAYDKINAAGEFNDEATLKGIQGVVNDVINCQYT